jgi:hypothetical protein
MPTSHSYRQDGIGKFLGGKAWFHRLLPENGLSTVLEICSSDDSRSYEVYSSYMMEDGAPSTMNFAS